MKKLKIYLDTSVINFLFADDALDYQKITKEFFDDYLEEYAVYVSEIVYAEINRTSDINKRELLLGTITKYKLEVFNKLTDEIERLADCYIKELVIPKNKLEDALHIAFSTFYEFDLLLSWNFKHLANVKKQMAVNAINEREGYTKRLLLINPMEVIYEK
ncbi:MAG: PIN domain-containing protein [Candidatus Margulisiibacteriota bacterium]